MEIYSRHFWQLWWFGHRLLYQSLTADLSLGTVPHLEAFHKRWNLLSPISRSCGLTLFCQHSIPQQITPFLAKQALANCFPSPGDRASRDVFPQSIWVKGAMGPYCAQAAFNSLSRLNDNGACVPTRFLWAFLLCITENTWNPCMSSPLWAASLMLVCKGDTRLVLSICLALCTTVGGSKPVITIEREVFFW